MDELPELTRLSIAEKDHLICERWSLVGHLTAQSTSLPTKVVEWEARLAQNRRNLSKPPSLDGRNKPKPQSLRQTGAPLSCGQKGHPGHTLKKGAAPDRAETHRPPSHYDADGG